MNIMNAVVKIRSKLNSFAHSNDLFVNQNLFIAIVISEGENNRNKIYFKWKEI